MGDIPKIFWSLLFLDILYSSSSSTGGRGGRSVRSHGPIRGAVKGVSSGQTTVWRNLVQPGDGRTAEWSAPVWERWKSVSYVKCHVQNCFGRYNICHARNVAEQWETAPANNRLDTLQIRSGADLGNRDEAGQLDARNPSLTVHMKGFQSLPASTFCRHTEVLRECSWSTACISWWDLDAAATRSCWGGRWRRRQAWYSA